MGNDIKLTPSQIWSKEIESTAVDWQDDMEALTTKLQ